jgi:hypothetical protein
LSGVVAPVAAHEQELHRASVSVQRLVELGAVHPRHDQVRDHEVHPARVPVKAANAVTPSLAVSTV